MSNLTAGPTMYVSTGRPTFRPVVIVPAPTMLVEPGYVDTMLANLTRAQIVVLSVIGCVALICMVVAFIFLIWYCCKDDDDSDDESCDNDMEHNNGKSNVRRGPSGYRERSQRKGRRAPWFGGSYNSAVKADQRAYSHHLKQEEWDRQHGTRDAFENANDDRRVTREQMDSMAHEYNRNNSNYNNNYNNNNNGPTYDDVGVRGDGGGQYEYENDPRSPRHHQEAQQRDAHAGFGRGNEEGTVRTAAAGPGGQNHRSATSHHQQPFNQDEDSDYDMDERELIEERMAKQRDDAPDTEQQQHQQYNMRSREVSPSRGGGGGRTGGDNVNGDIADNEEDDTQQQQQQQEPGQSMYPTLPSPDTQNGSEFHPTGPSAPVLPKRDHRKDAMLKQGKLGLMQGNQTYKDLMKPRKSLG